MKYIVYLTICTSNNKIYIGVHQTENPDIFDGYIGCGVKINVPASYKKSKTPFQYDVNKYGIDKFKRITLRVFDTKEEAFKLESLLIDEEFLSRNDTYNIKLDEEGGWAHSRLIKVYMYDLNGNFVREFASALECNKFFNSKAKNGSAVLKAIRLGHSLHGYQFSKEKLPFMKKFIFRKGSNNNKKKIGKYDSQNNLVMVYNSILSARKDGFNNVNKALKYGTKTKGYYFKYLK